jgi:tetratricopeptide (TPR) repeat protein
MGTRLFINIIAKRILVIPAFYLPVIVSSSIFSQTAQAPALLQEYLSSNDPIDTKITKLIDLAETDKAAGNSLEAIEKLQVALVIQEYEKPSPATSFNLYLNAGDLCTQIDPGFANMFYGQAIKIGNVINDLKQADMMRLYSNQAGVFMDLNKPDSALLAYRHALRFAKQNGSHSHVSALNNLGVYYKNILQPDSARHFLAEALRKMGDTSMHLMLFCAIRDNIAQLDYAEGAYQNAYRTFLYNDSVYSQQGIIHHK